MGYQLELIEYGGAKYYQAAHLRYRLFYEEHGLSLDAILVPQEADDQHLAIVAEGGDRVLAYGRLGRNSQHQFQVYQMVVDPDVQGQGLGTQLLQFLIDTAIAQGAKHLVLNARVTKISFYQKSGFAPIGDIFPSASTGVPHIRMERIV